MPELSRRDLALALVPALAVACGKAVRSVPEVVAVPRGSLPTEPADAAWDQAPVHVAPLVLQDMIEPRLMERSTPEVRVRAIADGARIAFRIEWPDSQRDDVQGPARFSDACAVQLPVQPTADAPAPQMGEAGRTVEITYWRASWQAVCDGRGDTIRDIYPNAAVDHYPFEAASLTKGSPAQQAMERRYAPARAVGNTMAGPREKPVQDLIAEGPGTLTPAPPGESNGRGRRIGEGWAVVISRKLPAGLTPGGRTQVAFAVWEGGHQEVGARKMRTGWVPLSLERA